MKKIFFILFFLSHCKISATWLVNEITNLSDLQLVKAARSDHDVEIQSISKKIEQASNINHIQLGQIDQFGSVGLCKIIAKNFDGKHLTIKFLSDPTYRVAQGRAIDSDLMSRQLASSHNQGMMARVILESQGNKKLIGSYCGYEKDNQLFNLLLRGKHGDYQVELILVN